MKQAVNISNRLKLIADWIPQGAQFVDIGSDHAYLPCYVCSKDLDASAIAGEVKEGPFKSAERTVKRLGLNHAVTVRLGDGFNVVVPGEVHTAVIAGMGGTLIDEILQNGQEKLNGIKRIIAQPNLNTGAVRKTLSVLGFKIIHEDMLEENGHIYEMIVADRTEEAISLDDQAAMFGPILLKHKPPIFYLKWEHEKNNLERVVKQMEHAKKPNIEKIAQFKKDIAWIEEVLRDE
ncbi:tRNA (adenine(22)-N(1))-methyltransferase [Lentibacillus sp. JNUCC-1]|uniref:tRNA (adenine(22)-N(1))-methyltransferase n=1 Tax=Lentibacillus sp. JNUCC-1 TaxID=2654513 RepID=UPI0012E7AE73|nr:tRNA (adenine(22)-N(1))-methyltransferase TrmK [Lentibacillus sp. JNUCC-1]MUV39616.1 tRNA (adenine(22)-N(1))-methyltransferase [Lentibacillus sp. JNUCC-1]